MYTKQNAQVLEPCVTSIRGHDFGQGVADRKKDRSLQGELFYITYDQQKGKKGHEFNKYKYFIICVKTY